MTTATYTRDDEAIRNDLLAVAMDDVYAVEDRISRYSIETREEYRAELERLAAEHGIPVRTSLPKN